MKRPRTAHSGPNARPRMTGLGRVGLYGRALLALTAVGLLGIACSPLEDESRAGVKLTVLRFTAFDAQGQQSDWLASDVARIDPTTGEVTVLEDTAGVEFRADFLNPTIQPSPFNDIIVFRYDVRYVRPDGRNTPGVDVPFPFNGTTNVHVPIGGTGSGNIVVVRAQAKLENPLFGLRFGGGEGSIRAFAHITFYGHDLFGRNVVTAGDLQIVFANWADR